MAVIVEEGLCLCAESIAREALLFCFTFVINIVIYRLFMAPEICFLYFTRTLFSGLVLCSLLVLYVSNPEVLVPSTCGKENGKETKIISLLVYYNFKVPLFSMPYSPI